VPHLLSDRIDRVVLHPIAGPLLLAAVLFLVFQAVFAWAETPMGWIEAATSWLGTGLGALLPEGWLRSLVVDGLVAGLGGVVVFLPQILILFFFILILEESGYLPRAAFLLDRLMGAVGLSGRSFIPLLSSFACAIPGILAARTIANPRDRIVTILVIPFMSCGAKLPVHVLLAAAFFPENAANMVILIYTPFQFSALGNSLTVGDATYTGSYIHTMPSEKGRPMLYSIIMTM
jgi:ferrous iron transport protein B